MTNAISMQLTDEPSRSKQAGPCWVGVVRPQGNVYAAAASTKNPRKNTIEVEVGAKVEIVGVANLRRATRTESIRRTTIVVATGNPGDVVHIVVVDGYLEADIFGAMESAR